MPKTELRIEPHQVIKGAWVFTLYYDDELIGEVTGADGPGVRVVSKFELTSTYFPTYPNVTQVSINQQVIKR